MHALLLLAVHGALALPSFPGVVQDQVGVPCEPPCALCHQGSPSGATATSDFLQALEGHGFQGNEQSLRDALDALGADGTDSDADGIADIDELVEGSDPNPEGVVFCDALTPSYGCLSTANRPPHAGGALLALLGLLGLARARRSAL